MAVKITKIWTRISTDTPFFVYPAETKQYIADHYEATGKITKVETNQAEQNGLLSKVTINIYRDAATLEEYFADPVLLPINDARNQYNDANGIINDVPAGSGETEEV